VNNFFQKKATSLLTYSELTQLNRANLFRRIVIGFMVDLDEVWFQLAIKTIVECSCQSVIDCVWRQSLILRQQVDDLIKRRVQFFAVFTRFISPLIPPEAAGEFNRAHSNFRADFSRYLLFHARRVDGLDRFDCFGIRNKRLER